jgi:hypothetical protein
MRFPVSDGIGVAPKKEVTRKLVVFVKKVLRLTPGVGPGLEFTFQRRDPMNHRRFENQIATTVIVDPCGIEVFIEKPFTRLVKILTANSQSQSPNPYIAPQNV